MSATLRLLSVSAAETMGLGRVLARLLGPGAVILLSGDLGAGKTALVKGVAEGLGTVGAVTSPTFNILVAHRGPLVLNHFDLYRLESASELEDIDFYGVIESGGVSFVEWGDRFPGYMPPDALEVVLSIDGPEHRSIELRPTGSGASALAKEWFEAAGGASL